MQRRQISMWSAVPTPMLWIRSVSYKGLTRVLPLAPPGFVQVGKMVPPALRALDCYPGSDVFIAGETCFVTHQGGATQKVLWAAWVFQVVCYLLAVNTRIQRIYHESPVPCLLVSNLPACLPPSLPCPIVCSHASFALFLL